MSASNDLSASSFVITTGGTKRQKIQALAMETNPNPVYPFGDESRVLPIPPFVSVQSGLKVEGATLGVNAEKPLTTAGGKLNLLVGSGLTVTETGVLSTTGSLTSTPPLMQTETGLSLNFTTPLTLNTAGALTVATSAPIQNGSAGLQINADNTLMLSPLGLKPPVLPLQTNNFGSLELSIDNSLKSTPILGMKSPLAPMSLNADGNLELTLDATLKGVPALGIQTPQIPIILENGSLKINYTSPLGIWEDKLTLNYSPPLTFSTGNLSLGFNSPLALSTDNKLTLNVDPSLTSTPTLGLRTPIPPINLTANRMALAYTSPLTLSSDNNLTLQYTPPLKLSTSGLGLSLGSGLAVDSTGALTAASASVRTKPPLYTDGDGVVRLDYDASLILITGKLGLNFPGPPLRTTTSGQMELMFDNNFFTVNNPQQELTLQPKIFGDVTQTQAFGILTSTVENVGNLDVRVTTYQAHLNFNALEMHVYGGTQVSTFPKVLQWNVPAGLKPFFDLIAGVTPTDFFGPPIKVYNAAGAASTLTRGLVVRYIPNTSTIEYYFAPILATGDPGVNVIIPGHVICTTGAIIR